MRICVAVVLLCLVTCARAEPWQRHTIDKSSRGADGVRLADVNGDGQLDIATGWEEGGQIRAYLHPGAAKSNQPWPAVTVGQVKSPEDAVFADLDGDGAVDVVSCCEGGNRTVFVHWAPTDATKYLDATAWKTEAIPCTEKKQAWMFALPMQVDGKLGIDLIVGSKGSGATIGWLQAPANARDVGDWEFRPLYKAGWIMSLQAHDLDDDGDLDVVASDRKGASRGILWLENPGAKAAAAGSIWNQHRIGGSDREVMFLALGDLDQDKQPDLVCPIRGRQILRFEQTGGASKPWQPQTLSFPADCGTGKGAAIGDVNLDGKMDIVFSCENASGGKSGMRWLSYGKSADEVEWQDHEVSGSAGVKFDRIELIDIDADGDLDILTCEERDNLGVFWYENPARSAK